MYRLIVSHIEHDPRFIPAWLNLLRQVGNAVSANDSDSLTELGILLFEYHAVLDYNGYSDTLEFTTQDDATAFLLRWS